MNKTIPQLVESQDNFVAAAIKIRLKQGHIDERDPKTKCTGLHRASQHVTDIDQLFSYISDSNNGFVRIPVGDIALINLLLDCGAEVDALDNLGRTPLYPASEIDCPQVMIRLITAGADVNIIDDKDITILRHLVPNSETVVAANATGILMEDTGNGKPIRVRVNAIRILRENGATSQGLSAIQKANLEIIENSYNECTYHIGRLASEVPYGTILKLELCRFWKEYKNLIVFNYDPEDILEPAERKLLIKLSKSQTELTGTIAEWLYILNAFKFYHMEYRMACLGIMDGSKTGYHEELFKGPFKLMPKLKQAKDLEQYLPELVKLLRSGAFNEIAAGPLALPKDVKKYWDAEMERRRRNWETPLLGGPPTDDYIAPSEDDESV